METTEYVIRLKDKLTNALKRPIGASNRLDGAMGRLKSNGSRNMSALGGSIKGLLGPLALAAAGVKAVMVAGDAVKVARNFEALQNAVIFASGSLEEGTANMEYLRQRSQLLGTDLLSSAEGFKTLSGAMIGSKLQGQATRDIFDSVQVAASVMGLSAENTKGTLLAFGQIMGKGKVQAEELRGQIGERIPGAFKLAADAMGVTTAELDKMMEQGELLAEDFLPKFADQLKKTFGPGLEKSVKSAMSNFNRFNNSILELKIAFGNSLMPAVNSVMRGLSSFFSFMQTNAGVITKALAPLAYHFVEVKNIFLDFFSDLTGGATAAETLQSAFIGLQNVLKFLEPMLEQNRVVMVSLLGAFLNISRGVLMLGSKLKGLGRVFLGFVFLIREGFIEIKRYAMNALGGIGNLVAGLFIGSGELVIKGLKDMEVAFNPVSRGQRLAGAFSDGFNAELIKDPLTLKFDKGKKPEGLEGSGVLKMGGGVDNGILGNLGISPGSTSTKATEEKKNKSSTTIDSVKSGRPTNININIGKLIESFNVTATNLDDMNNRAKDLVAQALLSAVNNVNNVAN
tara:strand:- start:4598 stop:6304 length:1707 start_codon:yes stop_codon:yes gene_type:complete